ncbi:NnrS family protein [Aliiroseovarius crassostreae]|uniref:NnrS family protein n=1 Tax=Aliiroseovarius crassostreae TaxID=154981 RepID=UPI0021FE2981|nr:NnrS family protein [Aliiroseovarius crassostreae]UWP88230.1 NnrS family protein [Aliiroseovarius crassostreae]
MADPHPSNTRNSSARVRRWTGPALLSFGYRPLFLGAGLWAVLAMVLWLVELTGTRVLATHLDPIGWHAHEMLFGYLGAALAGFMLTAVPNWTGRLPILGWPLAVLTGLWAVGRAVMLISALVPGPLVMALDLAFPLALLAMSLREVLAGRNWKNLPLLALFSLYILGNALFHIEGLNGGFPARGPGLRLGLSAALLLITLVGGRVIPSFTRNWLVKQGQEGRPAALGPFDLIVFAASVLVLLGWSVSPTQTALAPVMLLVGGGHLLRLLRWKGWLTRGEALLWVLHMGYLFVPLGFVAMGLSILDPVALPYAGALHLWMAGGIGVMTLAIMSRASLAHAGLPLHAGGRLTLVYHLIIGSVLLRFGGAYPGADGWANHLSALLWLAGFALFTVHYGPVWCTKPVPKRF